MFRTFLVLLLLAAPAFAATTQLFNGKNLDGWSGPGFTVENGILHTVPGKGLLWYTKEKLGNGVLRVVFKMSNGKGNSGVFIRIPVQPKSEDDAINKGIEVQIDDRDNDWHCTGVLYSMTKAMARPDHPPGQWNTMEITMDGLRTIVKINGVLVTDYDGVSPVPPKEKSWEPDRGPRPESGYIGLQNHDNEAVISFQEISFTPAIRNPQSTIRNGQRWWSHVEFLADDKLEGRNTGSEGHRKAAEYVAQQFQAAGLKPAGANGGYIQPVKFNTRRLLEDQSSVTLVRNDKPEKLDLGEDANISMRIDPAEKVDTGLVFVGYGLTVPELKYDDLAGLDLKGKVVMLVSGGPSSVPGPLRSHYQSAGERWQFLKKAGAIGIASVQNPKSMDIPWSRATLARFQTAMSLADPAMNETAGQKLALTINPAHADKFLAGSGHTFQEILALVDAGKPLPRFALPAAIQATVHVERSAVESQNIAGVLPGTDPKLKDEYVVLSAHVDHLGVGEPINGDRIYNGAMDNASGVAALLDIAETLHEQKKALPRSLLFVAVTGEEKGLLGSRYFAAHPTVPGANIIADLNMDMFLPLYPLRILTVLGLDESSLGDEIRAVAADQKIKVQNDLEPERNLFIRSDQYNFIRRGIPSLAFKVGYEKNSPEAATAKKWLTERYHAPSDDTKQPVDIQAAGDFDHIIMLLAEAVASNPARPEWKSNSFFRRFAEKRASD